jgi:hypothetical protein
MVFKKRLCWGCGREIGIETIRMGCYSSGIRKMSSSDEAVNFGTWVCNDCVSISKMSETEFEKHLGEIK